LGQKCGGCEACEPACEACEPACDTCCAPRCDLFAGLKGLFSCKRCCDPCGPEECCAEPACCVPEPECCEPECCEPCCRPIGAELLGKVRCRLCGALDCLKPNRCNTACCEEACCEEACEPACEPECCEPECCEACCQPLGAKLLGKLRAALQPCKPACCEEACCEEACEPACEPECCEPCCKPRRCTPLLDLVDNLLGCRRCAKPSCCETACCGTGEVAEPTEAPAEEAAPLPVAPKADASAALLPADIYRVSRSIAN
jgi:hypothetical protein